MPRLSEQIRAWRVRLGLTQAKAARRLGVPQATLENWEQGRNRPRGLALELLKTKLSTS